MPPIPRTVLPMGIHRLNKTDLAERNRKIEYMIAIGCSYSDIGRRYNLSVKTITTMVKRGTLEKGTKDCFRGTGCLSRSCFMDGIY